MYLTRLTDLSRQYRREKAENGLAMPNLSLFVREAPSDFEALIYEPVLCLILQGAKVTSIGDQTVELRRGDALVVSHDLPVTSRITMASAREPYLALILSIDLSLVRDIHDQVAHDQVSGTLASASHVRSLSSGPADDAVLAPLVRYLELMDDPFDVTVLGPSILREIHYRLLRSPAGSMLRTLLVEDSKASRVEKAIQRLRADFRSALRVPGLAREASMSVSLFHENFKSVTGTTPLRYLKDLRLIEARTLLLSKGVSVSETAYAVGYESPTHFSRDYSRKFGLPPSRDARGTMPTARDTLRGRAWEPDVVRYG